MDRDGLQNGFESILQDKKFDEDKLYEFLDALESLRVKEISRLMQLYNQEIQGPSYNIQNINFDGTSIEYIDNKLERLGLRRTYVINGGTYGALTNPEEDTEMTPFGLEFIKFFRSKTIYS